MPKETLVEVYKGHEILLTSPDCYTVRVSEGSFKGTEIAYKTSVKLCRSFIDGINDPWNDSGYLRSLEEQAQTDQAMTRYEHGIVPE